MPKLSPTSANSSPQGYATLALLQESAPNYNAWLGRQLRARLGKRVLEVGAGIGTITREILPQRDLVIALEAEATYAAHLAAAFQNEPRVRTIHRRVEDTDWQAFVSDELDSVLLSNVLEHIEDDAAAIRAFREALRPGGNLVILVPALPSLFGTLDEAVGHYRRYTMASMRRVIEENGFAIQTLEWLNLIGIPGWLLNSRVLKRRLIPAAQLRFYDRLAPLFATLESTVRLPIGLSLLSTARAV